MVVKGSVPGPSKTGTERLERKATGFASPPGAVHVGPQTLEISSAQLAITWQSREGEILIMFDKIL
jgi:hypothetical protein